jgi:DNA polymerase I
VAGGFTFRASRRALARSRSRVRVAEDFVAPVSPPPSPTLFLVDGYALIYRAFFALLTRPLTTAKGENTSAVWGVVNFLQRLITNHRPGHVGWVHDSGYSFRHEILLEYKATRQKLNEELQSDFDRGLERIAEILNAYRVPIITVRGYEADDVIATLAAQGVAKGLHVVVVSGDKDFQQLVRPGVWLLNPGRGGSANIEEHWVGLENASERLGVPPQRVVDYLALVGDTSDNVPGVPGIGDKTARDLVERYGDLENILTAAPSIEKKRPREALLAHADRARISKQLVTIRDDVPVALDLPTLVRRDPDVHKLRHLFAELEFSTLLRELEPLGERPARPDATYRVIDDIAELDRVVERIRAIGALALKAEVASERGRLSPTDALRTRLVGLSIALAPGEAFYLPLAHRPFEPIQHDLLESNAPEGLLFDVILEDTGGEEDGPTASPGARPRSPAMPRSGTESLAATALRVGVRPIKNLPPLTSDAMTGFRELLENAAIAKIGHNLKFEILVLRRAEIHLRGIQFDTMVASYVLDPGRRSHELSVLALELLDQTTISYDALCGKGKAEIPYDQVPVDAARDYACAEADVALHLRRVFEPELEAHSLSRLFSDIEIPLVHVLADMEWVGVSIETAWFQTLKEQFRRERERVEAEVYEEAGERFNINSNVQLRSILFDKLQLPIRKRTATGASTDASVLQQFAEEGYTLPSLLMEYREISKLESTYIDALPRLVNVRDGRLHTSFNQTVAATGRLSSSDPNLQNIPIRRELGRAIRKGFVPRSGWKLASADYSQIELRLLAHLSGDPAFVRAFSSGGDIHRETAAIIFGISVDAVTSDMRSRAKTINFATIYGQGATALSRQLRISLAEAKEFIATYFERFRGVRDYLDSMVASARERGYVETIFHRRRYIPELRERNFNIRAFGERVATNAPIQGSAADLIKIAMIRIHDAIVRERLAGMMIMQVHDELVFEVPAAEVDTLTALVRLEMENAARLRVPLVVDIGVGDNWLEAK